MNMDLNKILDIYQIVQKQFPTNTTRKNLFLATCLTIDSSVNLANVDLSCPHGGLIGWGDSILERLAPYSKILRLHAVLHDASGFMYSCYKEGKGYVYGLGWFPVSSPLVGHLSGISYCIGLKLFSRHFPKFPC